MRDFRARGPGVSPVLAGKSKAVRGTGPRTIVWYSLLPRIRVERTSWGERPGVGHAAARGRSRSSLCRCCRYSSGSRRCTGPSGEERAISRKTAAACVTRRTQSLVAETRWGATRRKITTSAMQASPAMYWMQTDVPKWISIKYIVATFTIR